MTPDDLSRHELRSLLARWGDWMERHELDASLPHQSAFMLIYADQPAGHKILCAEMTKAVWMINYHGRKLPGECRCAPHWIRLERKNDGRVLDSRGKGQEVEDISHRVCVPESAVLSVICTARSSR